MASKDKKLESTPCQSKSCVGKLIFLALCALFMIFQISQIKKTSDIIEDIGKSIRSEVCQTYIDEHPQEKHYFGKDLESIFNVKHALKTVSQNDFIENLLNGMDITQSERYQQDVIEYEKRTVQYGPYIERGFENDERFYIKLSSQQVGYGLFANVDILPNSVIGVYHGTLTHVKPYYTDTDYAWDYGTFPNPENPEENVEICIDGRTYGTWLRFVNHKNDAEANTYAIYVPYKNRWYIVYIARNFIPKDSELFISYGDSYWDARAETYDFEAEPEKAYNKEL
ncbi:SET domain-containing protein [Neocallimastix lanati (nom. inval.)]|jgi:hypothetical protein|uniref:SET domain-containing protein n=1 Tax=Neocallimastix californiae TaxID=1754190 RepID=A0A1Y2ESC0_9FUNG|nr:SET domain-containing protein [Neocallimastix sp. JGI-2020a]ORY74473.1 SET domain-containing protein [Neocallimastix californiae]|eukprot:ORY74473.1 SET domain-containing protein [Neocallimastix californiae]